MPNQTVEHSKGRQEQTPGLHDHYSRPDGQVSELPRNEGSHTGLVLLRLLQRTGRFTTSSKRFEVLWPALGKGMTRGCVPCGFGLGPGAGKDNP